MGKVKNFPTNDLEVITPEVALEWLDKHNDSNRPVSQMHVENLRQMILTPGAWRLTHQGIAFASDGRLIDGQHRLWAIHLSGKPVPMFVARGLDPQAVEALDKGKKRSVSDDLHMSGEKNTAARVAYTKQCANLAAGRSTANGGGAIQITTVSMFEAWNRPFGEGVEWARERFGARTSTNVMRRAAFAGTLAFCYKRDPEAIDRFAHKVISGADLAVGDPALALRNNLFAGTYHYNGSDIALKVMRAAYAEIHGESVQRIQVASAAIVDFFRDAYLRDATVQALIGTSVRQPPSQNKVKKAS